MADLLTRTNVQSRPPHEQKSADDAAHGQDVFNFEHWLKRFKLQDLRDVFREYDMHALSTLCLTDSNFARLVMDARVLARPHLIGDIIRAIQSVASTRAQSSSSPSPSKAALSPSNNTLILQMSRQETETVRELKRYKHAMAAMKDECRALSDECEAQKIENGQRVQSYQRVCTRQLSALKHTIGEHFDAVCKVLRDTQARLLQQVTGYEAEIAAIASAQTTRSAALDKVVHSYVGDIDAETHYIQQQIVRCKDIIADHCNHHNNNNSKTAVDHGCEFVTEFDDDRTAKVMRLGQVTKTHYGHALGDINAYKRDIDQFLHCAVLRGFEGGGNDDDDDDKQTYYHVDIDSGQRTCIEKALQNYVSISVDPRSLNRHNYATKTKNGFSAVPSSVVVSRDYDEQKQETTSIVQARSSVMLSLCAASPPPPNSKQNGDNCVKEHEPLPTAHKLDLGLTESKHESNSNSNQQIVSCQDDAYHRAFSTDLSINPFSVSPFAKNPFAKKSSPSKQGDETDDAKQAPPPPPPPKNDARTKEKKRYEKALKIANERYKAPTPGKEFNFFFDCTFLPKAISDAQDDGYQREFDYYVLRSPFKPQKQIRLTKLKKIKKLLPSLLSTSSTSTPSSLSSSPFSSYSHSHSSHHPSHHPSHSFLSASYGSPFSFNTNAPEFVPSHVPDAFGHAHHYYMHDHGGMNGHGTMNGMHYNAPPGLQDVGGGGGSFHQLPEIATILTGPPTALPMPMQIPMPMQMQIPLVPAGFFPVPLGPFSPMDVLSPLNAITPTPTHSAQLSPLHDNSPSKHSNNNNNHNNIAVHHSHSHHSNGTASVSCSPSRGYAMPRIEEEQAEEQEEEEEGEPICHDEDDNDEGMVFTFHPQNAEQLVAMHTM